MQAMTPEPQVTVRPARPGDAPEIANVHVHSWRETYKGLMTDAFLDDLPLFYRRRLAMWDGLLKDGGRGVYVAESEKHGIVGFASVGPARDDAYAKSGELTTIYLLRKYHRRGLGGALLRAGFAQLEAEGFATAYCWVLSNNDTVDFYRRLGAAVLRDTEKVKDVGGAQLPHVVCFWHDVCSPRSHSTARGDEHDRRSKSQQA